MNKFEIGDKVVVLPSENPTKLFNEGELLVVRHVNCEMVAVSREGDKLTLGSVPQDINVNCWFASRFRKATPAEEAGLIIGKEYVVIGGRGHHSFDIGDIVKFSEDDGSDCPKFKRVSDGRTQYLYVEQIKEHTQATPAQIAGLVIGERYEVIKDVGADGFYFRVGEVVTFYKDDGSSEPLFKYTSRVDGQDTCKEQTFYMNIDKVKPYVEPTKTPAEKAGFVVGKQYIAIKDVDGGDIFKKGEVVIFARDDGSTCPSFKYLKRDSDQSKSYDDEWYANLEDFVEIPNTTIVFDKVLTEAQIAAIRTLVG